MVVTIPGTTITVTVPGPPVTGVTTPGTTVTTPGTTVTTPGSTVIIPSPGTARTPATGRLAAPIGGAGAAGVPGGTGATPAPRQVGLLFVGKQDTERAKLIIASVRRSSQRAGMRLAYIASLREPIDVARLAAAANGTTFAGLSAAKLTPFSTAVGQQMLEPKDLIRKVRPAMFSSFTGKLVPLTGLAIAYDKNPKLTGKAAKNRLAVFEGLFKGMKLTRLPIVGVETALRPKGDTTLPFFQRYGITSFVDDINQPSGQQALSLLFQGAPPGHYGTDKGAKGLVPSGAAVSVGP